MVGGCCHTRLLMGKSTNSQNELEICKTIGHDSISLPGLLLLNHSGIDHGQKYFHNLQLFTSIQKEVNYYTCRQSLATQIEFPTLLPSNVEGEYKVMWMWENPKYTLTMFTWAASE